MGMFDSFYVQRTCEGCQKPFEDEIQVKDFDCTLAYWREWDYIGEDYTGSFDNDYCNNNTPVPCPHCKHGNPPSVVHVFRGIVIPQGRTVDPQDTYAVVSFLEEAARINNRKYHTNRNHAWNVVHIMEDWLAPDAPGFIGDLRKIHLEHNEIGIRKDDTAEEVIRKAIDSLTERFQ